MVEDLGSGNGTFVNDKGVRQHILQHGDVIRVCNAKFEFQETENPTDSVTMVAANISSPQIVSTLDANESLLRQDAHALTTLTNPRELSLMAERLRKLVAVSDAISSILDLDELLAEILNRLFDAFPKAERAIIMLVDGRGGPLVPKAVKRRRDDDEEELKISQTILQDVITHRQAVLSHDAMEDQRFKAGLSVANFGIRAMMAAPLVWRGEAVGVAYIDHQGIAAFSQSDLELLTGIAGQAAAALGNAQLHEELLKRQRFEQDLRLAERIQQSFLPRRIPVLDGFTFAARYDPAYEVGGDFYDFVHLPDQRLGIVVGDVAGKGIGAALYMARLTRDLRYIALAEADPARVLEWMNRAVADSGHDDIFVTLIYAVLDAPKARLTIANAGHMPLVVRRKAPGEVQVLDDRSGLPLGVLPDTTYESELFDFRPGDAILMFTDGLVEAMNRHREMFGMGRLIQVVGAGSANANTLMERALQACQHHVADAPQFDDTTAVAVSYDGVRR